jgi:hypothetical protein
LLILIGLANKVTYLYPNLRPISSCQRTSVVQFITGQFILKTVSSRVLNGVPASKSVSMHIKLGYLTADRGSDMLTCITTGESQYLTIRTLYLTIERLPRRY